MQLKKFRYPVLLTIISATLLLLSIPAGAAFGSEIDWLSQHVSIAEHFRQTFYENHSLLISFSELGGGSNFYMFAYYGYLRPDILIGCLLPMLSMKTILIVYAVLGVIASVNLCYLWLSKQSFPPFFCFLGSVLLACAACFFQAHRQLMFVNYLPWLFLALLSVDYFLKRRRLVPLVLSCLAIILHSFYFSISCFAVLFIYLLYRDRERSMVFRFILGIFLACALAAILLIPTALVLLEHSKDTGGGTSLLEILAVNPPLKNFLYSGYGCGLTIIALYGLLLGIRHRPTRIFSCVVFGCLFFNVVAFILNGGLYIKGKILIPFIPLILLICVTVLTELYQKNLRHNIPLLLLSFVPLIFCSGKQLAYLDAGFVLLFVILSWRYKNKLLPYLSLLVIPPLLFIQTNRTEEFVPADDTRQEIFSRSEMEDVYQDRTTRFDQIDFDEAIANVNAALIPGMKKTTMYSSTMNTAYSSFYYDTMKNAISINNRVALLSSPNPFFEYLMGVRYLQADKDNLPAGYEIKQERDGHVLAENDSVLPAAYVSYNLMSEQEFETYSFPQTLDTITNNTVVSSAPQNHYQSKITETTLAYQTARLPAGLNVLETESGYEVEASEPARFTVDLDTPIDGKTAIITFEVENPDGQAVIISLNKIRNKLSADSAAYPNHNRQFTYFLSSDSLIDSIDVSLSKGTYQISNIKVYEIENSEIGTNEVAAADLQETKSEEVLSGLVTAEQDGYFVTSLPIQNGYRATVDGKEVAIETVNQAFVGFPVTKGEHQIKITFTPPGRTVGLAVSLIGLILLLILCIIERTQHEKGTAKRTHLLRR
ncbi:YfhO family protein [Massiliimalia massiliensis]|uniref:YfhO family protein n=1 Tax=Massiliimalia massiliensis TaxID=1852384 RepID=UPI0009866DE9|nr:YfhO family protein [Massiliimalia massiliensis]